MYPAIGFVVIMGMVFGGFMLSGGHFEVILKALPFEMMMIGGAAAGAMIISNDPATLKALGGGMQKVMVGPKWGKKDYSDLLSLLFQLTKLMKTKGVAALEAHIDRPHESAIFTKYPKIEKDHFATDFICDTLRMMTMNLDDPHQVEDAMEKQLEKHHHEHAAPAHALQTMADGLPALGIVAAVLGIVKTMGAINEPPEALPIGTFSPATESAGALSFSSETIRCASFLPTPGACSTAAQLPSAMALARSGGDNTPSTPRPTLAPTPCTFCRVRNQLRSTSLEKP